MRFLDLVALCFIAALALPAAPGTAGAAGIDPVAGVIAAADLVGAAGGLLAGAVDASVGTVDHCDVSASCVLQTIERVIVPLRVVEVMIA